MIEQTRKRLISDRGWRPDVGVLYLAMAGGGLAAALLSTVWAGDGRASDAGFNRPQICQPALRAWSPPAGLGANDTGSQDASPS